MNRTRDQWNPNLYDTNHGFVSKYGSSLIELLNPQQGEKILDLGCGTGDLTQTIHAYGVEVTGVDKSENMIGQARIKYPHIAFTVKDAAYLEHSEEFDAVFSNAALHWVKPAKQALQSIFKSLKKGGRFVAEFGGRGNVQIITDEIYHQIKAAGFDYKIENFPWFFPSIAEYSTLMEETGFRVTFAQHFDRPTKLSGQHGLRNWIDMFAAGMFEGIPDDNKAEIMTKIEDSLKETLYKNGEWLADYKRIQVIGIKE